MSNESGNMIMGALAVTTVAAGVGCLATIISQQLNRFINNPYKNLLKVQTKTAERIGHPEIIINQFEDMIADGVVNVKELDVNLESIGGLEHIKRKLHETIILPLQRPEIFDDEHFLGPQKGVLLYGPPGTGKTMLAKALAKESSAVFINVRMSTVMSKWFGEAQKLVSAIFSLANKLQPAIIFIDEVDSFLGQRCAGDSGYYNSMKTEFMSLWDGFTTSKNARVLVLAATNRPTELDEAILRRFTQTFEVGLPDQTGRAAILKSILKKARVEDGIDYNHIASLTPGYSGSDLLELCREAAYYPIRDLLDGEKQEKATQEEEQQKKAVQNDKEQKKTHITRALAQADLETAVSAYKDMKTSVTDFKSDRQLGIWSRGDELYKTLYI